MSVSICMYVCMDVCLCECYWYMSVMLTITTYSNTPFLNIKIKLQLIEK